MPAAGEHDAHNAALMAPSLAYAQLMALSISLDNEAALVTGGGAGIGRAIALVLAQAGARLFVADRDPAGALATVADIEAAGGVAEALALDVADAASIADGIADAASRAGRLDILVNNAGVYPIAPFDDLADDIWDRTFAINLRGPFLAIRAAAKVMRAGGRIVNISSIDSLRPSAPGLGHYGASKAALNALTRSAAVEYGPRGIRVNALLPGVIATEGTSRTPEEARAVWAARAPAGRIGAPKDIAGATLFLVSPLAAFMHGQTMVVDGGLTING